MIILPKAKKKSKLNWKKNDENSFIETLKYS